MGLGWFFQISWSLAELLQSHCFNQTRFSCGHPNAVCFLDLVSVWARGTVCELEGDGHFWPSFGFNSESHGTRTLRQQEKLSMFWPASPPLLILARLRENWLRDSLSRMLCPCLGVLSCRLQSTPYPHDPSSPLMSPHLCKVSPPGHLGPVWKPPRFYHFLQRAPKSQKFWSKGSYFCSSLLAL